MKYKGHFDWKNIPAKFNRLVEYAKEDGKKHFLKKYEYQEGRVTKIIDYVNWIISEYIYISENEFHVCFYRFEDTPDTAELDSIKEFTLSNGLETKEILYIIEDGNKKLRYVGSKEYVKGKIVHESYKYDDGYDYVIKHNWTDNRLETVYPDNDGTATYIFNSEGYLTEYYKISPGDWCKKVTYTYENDRLKQMIDYPRRPYEKSADGEIILLEGYAVDVITTYYDEKGLPEKEIKTDLETEEVLDRSYLKFSNTNDSSSSEDMYYSPAERFEAPTPCKVVVKTIQYVGIDELKTNYFDWLDTGLTEATNHNLKGCLIRLSGVNLTDSELFGFETIDQRDESWYMNEDYEEEDKFTFSSKEFPENEEDVLTEVRAWTVEYLKSYDQRLNTVKSIGILALSFSYRKAEILYPLTEK